MMTYVASLPLASVQLTDGMLQQMQRLVHEKVLTYQWDILNDRVPGAAKSHCVENFKIAAGLSNDQYYGTVFQDSDLYKWLEAASYCIEVFGGDELQNLADEVCTLIGQAQGKDGYINTFYTVQEPDRRFTSLQQGHELYCAGHFFEAAVAYYNASGKRMILDVACRFADYLSQVFGLREGQIPGYPGHQEVEVGLVKLYTATGNKDYLKLADYFIAQRGALPRYFELERQKPDYKDIFGIPVMELPSYGQSHEPPVMQIKAVGHAVRALYMYSAMADLALLTDNAALSKACDALYANITQKQMYITGGVGSTEHGESFTVDYDLPNDTVYSESCASVALMMFAKRMAVLTGNGAYYDTVERAFFNRVLSGIAQSGTEFFYVGPLSVNPSACAGNPGLSHVKLVRQKWYEVACCPTNIARTIMSFSQYALGADENMLYIHIPLACTINTDHFSVVMDTQYPYGDELRISITGYAAQSIAIRKSGIAPITAITVNGIVPTVTEKNGYTLLRGLQPGDEVLVKYDMQPHYVVSHPKVTANVGKAAVARGPLVYCAEQADNGEDIACIRLPHTPVFGQTQTFAGEGTVALTVNAQKAVFADEDRLYQNQLPQWQDTPITLIPYYLWANRGEGAMQVYLNVQ